MSDPFDALRAPVAPVDPDPGFAADLRARLRAALDARRGTAMTATSTVPGTEARTHTLTPYLGVADGRRAIAWYVEVFDGRERGEPILMEDGSIGHAEIAIGDSVLMLAEGLATPQGPASHSVVLEVADVDATVDRAVAAGAELTRAPADNPYGRNAAINDPFGHRWLVSAVSAPTAAEAPAGEGRHGDIGYVSLLFPDDARARAFYGAVLGWTFTPGGSPRGWQVEQARPGAGLAGGAAAAEVQLCYQVDDVDAAVRRVRAAGGEAADADARPYGRMAECTDDQGVRFQVWQPG